MTTSDHRRRSSLEAELSAMYRPAGPSAILAEQMDARISSALANHRGRPVRTWRRTLLLAASASLLAVVALAGDAMAQRLASGCRITVEDGISFNDCVIGRPGLTNFGQPFWGTDILDGTPAEAAETAAEKGYTIRWQIEDRAGTEPSDDDATRFSDEPPACGHIEGGSVIEEGRIQMVVVIDDPLTPSSEC